MLILSSLTVFIKEQLETEPLSLLVFLSVYSYHGLTVYQSVKCHILPLPHLTH
jgi:hypothetical protein